MKKLLLSLALILGVYAFTNAQTLTNQDTEATEVVTSDEGYKVVSLEDLSETIQNAIKNDYSSYTVKSTAYNEEKKIAKVTLTSKEDQSEKIVLLNEEGKEVTE